ncbi:hypothetical protein PPTG_22754 [Phytophthora nicotianae INRA-310]|uniref:Uncharacterized protein n=1 Tax=Phytophthora nicotianae (strain INRA-310) TaxID=761204 RepID=W2QD85_PHYN3|nr:hypothetical protein PPTG_22754 [Phytophthora nicotianae INRA-310]ETN10489.1 hypothetical protein PPTG_22754 [Phytophthora nicotianae INRA-310]
MPESEHTACCRSSRGCSILGPRNGHPEGGDGDSSLSVDGQRGLLCPLCLCCGSASSMASIRLRHDWRRHGRPETSSEPAADALCASRQRLRIRWRNCWMRSHKKLPLSEGESEESNGRGMECMAFGRLWLV